MEETIRFLGIFYGLHVGIVPVPVARHIPCCVIAGVVISGFPFNPTFSLRFPYRFRCHAILDESLRWAGPSGTCCYSRRSVLCWMLVLVGLSGNTAKDYSIPRNACPCAPHWTMRVVRIYIAHPLRAVLYG